MPHDDPATVSVVIPALNEARTIRGAVHNARQTGADEVIVVDGGSTDATRAIARDAGAQVITAPRGRGPQLNAGAAVARGAILGFLHADNRLPVDASNQMRAALADPTVIGGNFRVTFGATGHARFLAAFYRVLQPFGVIYGDAAIFCRREAWRRGGGYPPHPIMEDLAFVTALRRRGRWRRLDAPTLASPRRWEQGGIAQAWAAWAVIQSLYFLHVPPPRLAALYRQIR